MTKDKTKDKNFKYVSDDYKYQGLLMSKTGQDSLGIIELEKAIALDPAANCELNEEIAKVYLKTKKYDKSLEYFEKRALCTKPFTSQDYFDKGRAYFYGPKKFVEADSCFSKLIQATPNYATAYFWRAKANIQLDPKNEKWLAKPMYEMYISKVKPEDTDKNKKDLVEANTYMGVYFMNQKDRLPN